MCDDCSARYGPECADAQPAGAEMDFAMPGEANSAGLIVVTQLPEIEQRLYLVKAQIERAVADALAMEVTEENRAAAKAQLADLRKGIKALEDQRLAIRREILAPYDEMEAVYRACVTDVWKPAEAKLSGRIAEIESGIIGQKRAEVERYFSELCAAHSLDFLRLEDSGAKINQTTTAKASKAQVKAFIERVVDDLSAISLHEYRAEILVEYKANGFNQQRATIEVCRRVDAANAERARQELLAAQREQEAAAMARIEEAAEAFSPPVQEPAPMEELPAADIDPVMTIAFRVTAPKSKLIGLREYMKQEGITYGN